MRVTDTDLWRQAQAGNLDAFALLFERHARTIYNYCFRRVGDWATAEDLLSIVFLIAWRRRTKTLPDEGVLPWLYGIATNVVRNQRRSQRRCDAALRRVPGASPEPNFSASSDERVDAERQVQPALALLDDLTPDERDVFALCAWMELTYEDAAAALGIPVGTVRSRLARARRRLGELNPGSGHREDRTATPQEAHDP